MTMRPVHAIRWAAFAGAAFLTLAAGAAPAATPETTRPRAHRLPAPAPALALQASRAAHAAPPAASPGARHGLMAFLDPETGLLGGPAGDLSHPADPFAPVVLLEQVPAPGGGWMMDLKGTGLEYYVLHVDALGARSVSCVQDPRRIVPRLPAPGGPRAEER